MTTDALRTPSRRAKAGRGQAPASDPAARQTGHPRQGRRPSLHRRAAAGAVLLLLILSAIAAPAPPPARAQATDPDGDGLPDPLEARGLDADRDGLVSELDLDSDGDGIPDGVEDRDRDGVRDPGETDPQDADTDRDGIPDGVEDADLDGAWDAGETGPAACDSDGDLVPDGREPFPFCDVDGDGLPNAADPDSDGDGLGDGDELAWATDPLRDDSDADGIADAQEARTHTNPLSADSDADGIPDAREALGPGASPDPARLAWWREAEELAAKYDVDSLFGAARTAVADGAGFILSGQAFTSLPPGSYRCYLRARPVKSLSGRPTLKVRFEGPEAPLEIAYPLPWVAAVLPLGLPPSIYPPPFPTAPPTTPPPVGTVNPYRWYCTPPLEFPQGGALTVTATCPPGEEVYVDRLLLVRVEEPLAPLTHPLNADTDSDGVRDGDEGPAPSWWWEAEAFPPDPGAPSRAVPDPWASSGFLAAPGPDGSICRIETPSALPAGSYCLLVRGRPATVGEASAGLRVSLALEPAGSGFGQRFEGRVEVPGGYPQGRWVLARLSPHGAKATAEAEEPGADAVADSLPAHLAVAGPARLTLTVSAAPSSAPVLLDQVALVPAHLDPARTGPLLPRRATNPLDPDTDGDRLRLDIAGPLAGFCGYLFDGVELKLGTHPLDCDTDGDGAGPIPEGMAGPQDAAPGTDALDPDPWTAAGGPNPWRDDFDRDGLPDRAEDADGDGAFCPENGETDWRSADTDRDGLSDAQEDWDGDGVRDPGETDPLDPDTDGDGLVDGTYLPDTHGSAPLVYDAARPEQMAAFNSVLARIGRPVDPRPGKGAVLPYVEPAPGQLAFLGETDINVRARHRARYGVQGPWRAAGALDPDSDRDGIPDGLEILGLGTNPLAPDSDSDGLPDPVELETGTNPIVPDLPDLAMDPGGIGFSPHPALAVPGGSWLEVFATLRNLSPVDAPGPHRVRFYAGVEGASLQPCGEVLVPSVEARGARKVRLRVLLLPAQELESIGASGGRPPCFALGPGRYRLEAAVFTALNQGVSVGNDRAATELVVEDAPAGDDEPGRAPAEEAANAPPSGPRDADGDGLADLEEARLGTDPTRHDSDGDLVPDGEDLDPRSAFALGMAPQAGSGGGWSRSFGPGFLRLDLTIDAYGLEGRPLARESPSRYVPLRGPEARAAVALSPRDPEAARAALCPPGFELESVRLLGSRAGPTLTWPDPDLCGIAGPEERACARGRRVEYRTWIREYRVRLVNRQPMEWGGFWSAVAPVAVAGEGDQELLLQFTIEPAWDRTRPQGLTPGETLRPLAEGGRPWEPLSAGPQEGYRLPALCWRLFAGGDVAADAGSETLTLRAQAPPLASGTAVAARCPRGSSFVARIPLHAWAASPGRAGAPSLAGGAGVTRLWLELVPAWLVGEPEAGWQGAPARDSGGGDPHPALLLEPLDPRALRFSAAIRHIALDPGSVSRKEAWLGAASPEGLGTLPPSEAAAAPVAPAVRRALAADPGTSPATARALFTYKGLPHPNRLAPVSNPGSLLALAGLKPGPGPAAGLYRTALARALSAAAKLINARLAAGEPACLVPPQARPSPGTLPR
ncbi:MAG: hypothetical protein K6T75_08245 [Acetobacteraceae bacterium]|nr:hypothetical protein [Acetobacteraceae bacterium]